MGEDNRRTRAFALEGLAGCKQAAPLFAQQTAGKGIDFDRGKG